jgi:hypothetical protein
LQNVVVIRDGNVFCLNPSWLAPVAPRSAAPTIPVAADLAEREKAMIENALREAENLVSGPTGAALETGMPRQTLESKIKEGQNQPTSFQDLLTSLVNYLRRAQLFPERS